MLAAHHINNNLSELKGWNTNYCDEWSPFLKFLFHVSSRHMSAHRKFCRCIKVVQITECICVRGQAVVDIQKSYKEKEITSCWEQRIEREKNICEGILTYLEILLRNFNFWNLKYLIYLFYCIYLWIIKLIILYPISVLFLPFLIVAAECKLLRLSYNKRKVSLNKKETWLHPLRRYCHSNSKEDFDVNHKFECIPVFYIDEWFFFLQYIWVTEDALNNFPQCVSPYALGYTETALQICGNTKAPGFCNTYFW